MVFEILGIKDFEMCKVRLRFPNFFQLDGSDMAYRPIKI